MKATARDMRYHLRSVMAAVERGEKVYVTNRGRIKARLTRVETQEPEGRDENPFVGMWRDRDDMRDVQAYTRRLRAGRGRK